MRTILLTLILLTQFIALGQYPRQKTLLEKIKPDLKQLRKDKIDSIVYFMPYFVGDRKGISVDRQVSKEVMEKLTCEISDVIYLLWQNDGKTYYTADTTTNDQTIISMRSYLNALKTSGDSINGVHIAMTNDMPYKYYLKSIEIFLERPPRIFFTIENNFYAVSKSKYQQTQDSILKTKAAKDGVTIGGHEY